MPFVSFFNKLSLKYAFFRTVKDWLRPIKHSIFGKDDIYWVIDEIKKARGNSHPVTIIFDVGAAIGDKAITFLKSFPEATVYCFEPQRESLECLKKRTARYKERIKTFDFGLLNKNSYVDLNITSYKDASSILPLQKYMKNQGIKEIGKERIRVMRLDDFIKQNNISHVDLIKIDVEGVEKEVLEGGKEAFKNKIDNVFIEISSLRKDPYSKEYIEIFKFFHELNFIFIGCYGDYFFSKDRGILRRYFN